MSTVSVHVLFQILRTVQFLLEFGRIAAQIAKQVIVQKVKDAERDIIINRFRNRVGELLSGMTILTYSEDPVAAAKAAYDFSKENDKLSILGGAMGENILDVAGVKSVAALPSREELIASIVGCIGAPASNIASAICFICP